MIFDLVILGAGPAGEAAAKVAAKQKAKVLLIERESVGGLCLNHGCIPSKALLALAKKWQDASLEPLLKPQEQNLPAYWQLMQEQKNQVVLKLREQIHKSLKLQGVDLIQGQAQFESSRELLVKKSDDVEKIEFKNCVIATGSQAFYPPPFDKNAAQFLNSDKILALETLPKTLTIVGGGAIGCEFACLLNALGVKITLIEKMDQLLPGEDAQIAGTLRKSFEKRGIQILTSATAQKVEAQNSGQRITLVDGQEIANEQILLCVGRKPDLSLLNLQKAGVQTSGLRIETDDFLRTNQTHIFAAGDVTGRSLLAHAGAAQGEIAAGNALGAQKKYNGALVPRCLYTWPEVASVGLWKKDAEAQGLTVRAQRFFFEASGKALAEQDSEGYIQILSNSKSDELLGAQMIGPHVTELIHLLAMAIHHKLKREDLRQVIFAHPTLSESISIALSR